MEGVERYRVRRLPYNEEWKSEFLHVKRLIEAAWSDNLLDIQHVGSTAIPGIWAKPVLDIAVRLNSIEKMDVDSMRRL